MSYIGILIRHALAIIAWVAVTIWFINSASHFRGSNLSVEFDTPQNGFMQIFYPDLQSSNFEAKNSERYGYEMGSRRRIAFQFPSENPNLIRIDPAEDSVELTLRSIELNSLFGSVTVKGEELLHRLRPVQDVNEVAITGGLVQISTSGFDPILMFDTRNLVIIENEVLKLALVALIAGFGYFSWCVSVISGPRKELKAIYVALCLSLLLLYIFFPGYMTYDSFHALRSARDGVTDSIWPPMVSYIWRGVDMIYPHPAAMFFLQVSFLLTATALILVKEMRSVGFTLLSLLILLLNPTILGTISAIWKDVLMAALFLAAYVFMLQIKRRKGQCVVWVYFAVALIFVFLGSATRHNAITAAVPLTFYLTYLTLDGLGKPTSLRVSAVISALLVAGIFGGKTLLDNYSLPTFKSIAGTSKLVDGVRRMDLVAASICVGENLFGEAAPQLTIDDMRAGYDARHVNYSSALLKKIPADADTGKLWLRTLLNHPLCLVSNKAQLTAHLFGLRGDKPFLIITPQVDFNEFGYYLPNSVLRKEVEGFVISAAGLPIFKPWFLWVLCLGVFCVYILRNRAIHGGYAALWCSATLYGAGLSMMGNAADARLLFYTNYVCIILILMTARDIWQRRL